VEEWVDIGVVSSKVAHQVDLEEGVYYWLLGKYKLSTVVNEIPPFSIKMEPLKVLISSLLVYLLRNVFFLY
jgi:hypothetical protein